MGSDALGDDRMASIPNQGTRVPVIGPGPAENPSDLVDLAGVSFGRSKERLDFVPEVPPGCLTPSDSQEVSTDLRPQRGSFRTDDRIVRVRVDPVPHAGRRPGSLRIKDLGISRASASRHQFPGQPFPLVEAMDLPMAWNRAAASRSAGMLRSQRRFRCFWSCFLRLGVLRCEASTLLLVLARPGPYVHVLGRRRYERVTGPPRTDPRIRLSTKDPAVGTRDLRFPGVPESPRSFAGETWLRHILRSDEALAFTVRAGGTQPSELFLMAPLRSDGTKAKGRRVEAPRLKHRETPSRATPVPPTRRTA
jgi:hypothetical protein